MTGGTAADRALRVLADPPGWLRAAVDGDAVLRALRGAPSPGAPPPGAPAPGAGGPEHPGEDAVLGDLGGDVVACDPVDVRLDGDGWRGWYALTVRGADGVTRRVEVSGSLHPPAVGERAGTGAGPSASGPPRTTPVGRLVPVGEHGDLPAFGVLTDPEASARLLERVVGGGAVPGFRVVACAPRVVRHARGARVTVVLRAELAAGADPAWPRTVVAKAYRADEGAATHAAMTALWASPLAASPAVVVARPLGYDPALGVLLQGAVPDERTLTALVVAAVGDGSPAALDRLRAALRGTAEGLVALHAAGVGDGAVRTPDALVARVRRAARRLGDVLPDGAATVDALVAPLVEAAARHPADPPVPSHGGFRPAQVLLDADDRPGFIDFDGFCRAEPAFDLGRFRARLREIVLAAPGGRDPALSPGRRRLADELADVLLDRYLAAGAGLPVQPERVAVWERLELVTALVQTWTRAQLTRTPPLAVLLGADPPP